MRCRVFPLSYTRSTKTISLKLNAYSFSSFLSCNQKNLRLAPFMQVKVFIVNSAGGSFCWNSGTDTFYGNYAGDNVCCIYAGFQVILSVTGILVDIFIAITQVTGSIAIMQLEVFAALL